LILRVILWSGIAVTYAFLSIPKLAAQAELGKEQDPQVLLQEASAKLLSLQRISYHYRRELTYPSENFRNVLEGDISLEFDPTQEPIGAIYQAHFDKGFEIYNGSEILRINSSDHTLQMTAAHTTKDLDHLSFLYNSMVTLRLALPMLIHDATITKSIAQCSAVVCEVDLHIPHAVLTATGALSPVTSQRDFTYRIILNRKSLLPVEVRQTNNANSDSMLVQFSEVNDTIARLPAESWLYSSYRDYRLVMPTKTNSLAVGSIAPDWMLPVANAIGSVQRKPVSLKEELADPKTKLVLIEFWISHCGYSIDAVPKLNAISAKYGLSGLKILAVNPDDNESTIQLFAQNYMPHYALLSEGSKASEQYGVPGFPFIFLVNTEGKIIYAGGLDEKALSEKMTTLLP
jgi:thiol-disulfide isomerase/thioredoxin